MDQSPTVAYTRDTHLVKQFQQIHIIRFVPEMFLEEVVYRSFEHERVVDRDGAHRGEAEPARLAAPRVRGVHYVVCNKEKGLQLRHRAKILLF